MTPGMCVASDCPWAKGTIRSWSPGHSAPATVISSRAKPQSSRRRGRRRASRRRRPARVAERRRHVLHELVGQHRTIDGREEGRHRLDDPLRPSRWEARGAARRGRGAGRARPPNAAANSSRLSCPMPAWKSRSRLVAGRDPSDEQRRDRLREARGARERVRAPSGRAARRTRGRRRSRRAPPACPRPRRRPCGRPASWRSAYPGAGARQSAARARAPPARARARLAEPGVPWWNTSGVASSGPLIQVSRARLSGRVSDPRVTRRSSHRPLTLASGSSSARRRSARHRTTRPAAPTLSACSDRSPRRRRSSTAPSPSSSCCSSCCSRSAARARSRAPRCRSSCSVRRSRSAAGRRRWRSSARGGRRRADARARRPEPLRRGDPRDHLRLRGRRQPGHPVGGVHLLPRRGGGRRGLRRALLVPRCGAGLARRAAGRRAGRSRSYGALTAVTLLLAWTLGVLVSTAQRSRRNRREADEAGEQVAAEQERTRIARDMHDVVAHSLAVVIAQSDGARMLRKGGSGGGRRGARDHRLHGPRRARGRARAAAAAAVRGDDERAARGSRTSTRCSRSSAAPASSSTSRATTTSARSAPRPSWRRSASCRSRSRTRCGTATSSRPASVVITRTPHGLEVEVVNAIDPARPARPSPGGHGLIGMRERAGAVQGDLKAGPDGDRFRVRAFLPLGRPPRSHPDAGCPR